MMVPLLATLLTVAGLGAFAIAMPQHWQQMPDRIALRPRPAVLLRLAGSVALLVSLLLCVDGGSIAIGVLVWIMQIAISASIVATLLAMRT